MLGDRVAAALEGSGVGATCAGQLPYLRWLPCVPVRTR